MIAEKEPRKMDDAASPSTKTNKAKSSPQLDRMQNYKGTSFQGFWIPEFGIVSGLVLPLCLKYFGWFRVAAVVGNPADPITLVIQQFGYVAIMFASEFFWGIKARSSSPKASFDPTSAALVATNVHDGDSVETNPFSLIRTNRIEQNHIESFCVFGPAALAAAAAAAESSPDSADDIIQLIRCCVVSWVLFRLAFRAGYCYEPNPFWRCYGVAGSLTQSLLCLILWSRQQFF